MSPINTSLRKKKCNLVLEILTSFTYKNTTLFKRKRKYGWNYSTKIQKMTILEFFFANHMVSFMLEK